MMLDIKYFADLEAHVVLILEQGYLLVIIQNEQTLRHSFKIILNVIIVRLKGNDPATR